MRPPVSLKEWGGERGRECCVLILKREGRVVILQKEGVLCVRILKKEGREGLFLR